MLRTHFDGPVPAARASRRTIRISVPNRSPESDDSRIARCFNVFQRREHFVKTFLVPTGRLTAPTRIPAYVSDDTRPISPTPPGQTRGYSPTLERQTPPYHNALQ